MSKNTNEIPLRTACSGCDRFRHTDGSWHRNPEFGFLESLWKFCERRVDFYANEAADPATPESNAIAEGALFAYRVMLGKINDYATSVKISHSFCPHCLDSLESEQSTPDR